MVHSQQLNLATSLFLACHFRDAVGATRLVKDSCCPLSVFDIHTITEKELVEVLETILA